MDIKWLLFFFLNTLAQAEYRNRTNTTFLYEKQKNLLKVIAPGDPDISTAYFFPDYLVRAKPIEHFLEPLEIVINIRNDGKSTKEVKAVIGYLADSNDPTIVRQTVSFILD